MRGLAIGRGMSRPLGLNYNLICSDSKCSKPLIPTHQSISAPRKHEGVALYRPHVLPTLQTSASIQLTQDQRLASAGLWIRDRHVLIRVFGSDTKGMCVYPIISVTILTFSNL